jgi:adenylosuccinate synthase
MDMVGGYGRTHIHPHACVLTSDHADRAKKTGARIAGTMKGTGHALADKLLRKQEAVLAKHMRSINALVTDTRGVLRDALRTGPVLNEMAQGFDLSLNWGREWPYCTSRDVTVGTALNNAGLPASCLGDVWGVIRPFPIRVGNIYKDDGNKGMFNDMDEKRLVGWSGPCWDDQRELTWDEVTKLSGSPTPLLEKTTVTQRVRRVFTFSTRQLREFCIANEPSHLFVNFIQYLDWSVAGTTDPHVLMASEPVRKFLVLVETIAKTYNQYAKVAVVGTGAKHSEMVELPHGILR